ncbi:uncharacterized protein LOC733758 isoform X1 [Xenopus tropicalis]|uniref:Novel protein n=1 Tax=Xenopus tropicalis TaxID=8364 RepID=Q28FQ1_XENTR|nr:uncharacterized protein LOC733758 [Xenopus tropicalis]XP_031753859.1 uncharacterized protein LOC733758 isoform X1 [Xenopus tropicalis]XP_031753860.1 uncharacterized protein LOC733758 isoform X1 [Xenopus tropicalis]XP_031753861.1 uncharacterized protein LOC733758 isoform X1 [Xenopus tropicalis]XP_031753862.1 uncharacterized protein LOC733758 isoform X1 [Xenopus tropicalis]XP_031753863.1 uncharacterized protein LOC733758 isoform X1 [Xenopus tropicalis]CAJ83796.1 novel protein [Xenopus tropic|eukprot:NP_001037975.1 uncharacterized protein LOC733758 [Xenopus tropicalis]
MGEPDDSHVPLLRAMQDRFVPKSLSIAGKSLLTAIHIANIAIGAFYINDCPGQYLIPYYLIITGAVSLLLLFLTCLPCGDGREPPRTSWGVLCTQGVLMMFLFIFFIAGNVWVYSLYQEPWDSPESPKRCNRVLYLYAFWVITAVYIFAGVVVILYMCALFCLALVGAYVAARTHADA